MTAADLREARETLGLSQPQMADALATPVGTYRGWEQGRYEIPGVVAIGLKCLLTHKFASKQKSKNRA